MFLASIVIKLFKVMRKLKVLYIYDFEEWAIHNVGKVWSGLLHQTHDFRMVQLGQHLQHNPKSYDIILWGFSLLALRHNSIVYANKTTLCWEQWNLLSSNNLYTVVHDPCEIYEQVSDWKNTTPKLSHLHYFSKLAVISNEMEMILSKNKFDVCKVNTMSHIPLRSEKEIVREQLKIFTRANPYPRKNLNLFYEISNDVNNRGAKCEAFVGGKFLPEKDYIKTIDKYNCYICTSWQEGGPLPLMDAMRRGCVVLTTRVGQTDTIIEDGVNGFFCNRKEDFLERIGQLFSNSELLYCLRRNALKTASVDKGDVIHKQLLAFLK